MVKPPYQVPTMAEIRDLPWNGLNAVSTFSGCGGSSLGYRMAGYRMLWASEFIPAAQDTYRANAAPYTTLDTRDIRQVSPDDILTATGLQVGELDLFDGSPPCASFSTAGKREAGWGKVKKYCISMETKVLTTALEWVSAGSLHPGDEVVGFDEGVPGQKRKFRRATVESTDRIVRPSYRLVTSDGATVTCSAEHRWLIQQGRNLRWRATDRIRPGDVLLSIGRPWKPDRSYESGYLSGIFDGEGCVSRQANGATRLLGFAQRPGPVLDEAVRALKLLGAEFGVYPNGPVNTVNVNGGPFSKARILGITRPVRLLSKAHLLWDGVGVGAAQKVVVTSIEPVGDREVVALSTSTRTFIADGLLSHNSDTTQRTDDLFFEFVRLITGVQPKTFVAENVSGLVKGSAKGYFMEIMRALKGAGYRVGAKLLDAQWLGVPQARQRLIFVGVREDLGIDPVFPAPLPYRYTVRDALPHILTQGDNGGYGGGSMRPADHPSPTIGATPQTGNGRFPPSAVEARVVHDTSGQFSTGDVTDRPCPTILVGPKSMNSRHYQVHGSAPASVDPETGKDLSIHRYAIGREWERLQPGQKSDRYLNLVRPDEDRPSPTVTAHGGNISTASVAHPVIARKFTLGELRRICGFPDDFTLTGTYEQRWERLGRAVPPVMMAHIAATIRDRILTPLRQEATQ